MHCDIVTISSFLVASEKYIKLKFPDIFSWFKGPADLKDQYNVSEK